MDERTAKLERLAKQIKKGAGVIIVFLVIPVFFKYHENYRFFFALLCGAAILIEIGMAAFQVFWKQQKPSRSIRWYLAMVGWIILSVFMAYQMYRKENLTGLFPFLQKITNQHILLAAIILSVLAVIVILLCAIMQEEKNTVYSQKIRQNSESDQGIKSGQRQHSTENEGDKRKEGETSHSWAKGLLTFIIFMLVVAAAAGVVIYALTNNNSIMKMIEKDAPAKIIQMVGMMFTLLCLIFVSVWIVCTVFRQFYRVLRDTIENKGSVDTQNEDFRRTVSWVILFSVYILMPNTGISEWMSLVVEPDIAAPALTGIVFIIGGIIFSHVICQALDIFTNRENEIRKEIDKIFNEILKIVVDTIKGIFEFLDLIPDFIKNARFLICEEDEEYGDAAEQDGADEKKAEN